MKKLLLLYPLLLAYPAHAVDVEFNNGALLTVDATLTYGAQWRVEDRDDRLSGQGFLAALREDPFLPLKDPDYTAQQSLLINSDDGNNNFDTGLVSQRITLLVDMDLNWDSYGVFLRGKAFYDQVYSDNDTNLSEDDFSTYNSGTLYGGDAQRGEFPRQTKDSLSDNIEFLDAFIYGTWELPGDRLMDLRVGRQVINWGESTFYQGINSIQNRADAFAANTPGVEVKEILLPTGAVYLQVDLIPGITLETYYQYEWIENELDGIGSYFATADGVGPGAYSILIPTPNGFGGNEFNLKGVPRTQDDNASDSGQWGIGMHWVTDNNWDLGFYHVNGHDKKPLPEFEYVDVPGSPQPVPETYRLKYFEDIKGTAFSFTTVMGETNVQGEVSFLDGTPMVDVDRNPQREDLLKIQLGGTHVFGPSFLADDTVITFEAFYADVTSADGDELNDDDSGWGWSALGDFSYNNVFQGWDLKVPVYVKHDVDGIIRELRQYEESVVVSLGLSGIYLNNFTASATYAYYFGGGSDNLIRDRDNIALTLKYNF